MRTIILLFISNTFMMVAWYGHLKFKNTPLLLVILACWGIAFFEYLFQVPANRMGHGQFNLTQLKVIQEVITLCVFVPFAIYFMQERMNWNHLISFCFLVLAVFFAFRGLGSLASPGS